MKLEQIKRGITFSAFVGAPTLGALIFFSASLVPLMQRKPEVAFDLESLLTNGFFSLACGLISMFGWECWQKNGGPENESTELMKKAAAYSEQEELGRLAVDNLYKESPLDIALERILGFIGYLLLLGAVLAAIVFAGAFISEINPLWLIVILLAIIAFK